MSLLNDLRSLVPDRVLTVNEAMGLAEREATRLLKLGGVQNVVGLANLFEVSPQAMHVRLMQLGLIERPTRCRVAPGDQELAQYFRVQSYKALAEVKFAATAA